MTSNLHNFMWSKTFRQVESDKDDKTMMLTMLYMCKQFKDHKNNMWKYEQNKTWEKMTSTICNICKSLENKMTFGILRQWHFAMAINIMKWKNDRYAQMNTNMTKFCQKKVENHWDEKKNKKKIQRKEIREGKKLTFNDNQLDDNGVLQQEIQRQTHPCLQ
jgi:hypothetical protein